MKKKNVVKDARTVSTETAKSNAKRRKEDNTTKNSKVSQSKVVNDRNPSMLARDQYTANTRASLHTAYTSKPIRPVGKRRDERFSIETKFGNSSQTAKQGIVRSRLRARYNEHMESDNVGNLSRTSTDCGDATNAGDQHTENMFTELQADFSANNPRPSRRRQDNILSDLPAFRNPSQVAQNVKPVMMAEKGTQANLTVERSSIRATQARASRRSENIQTEMAEEWNEAKFCTEPHTSNRATTRSTNTNQAEMSEDCYVVESPSDLCTPNTKGAKRRRSRSPSLMSRERNASDMQLGTHSRSTVMTPTPRRRFSNTSKHTNPTPGGSKRSHQSSGHYATTASSKIESAKKRGRPAKTSKDLRMANMGFGSHTPNTPLMPTSTQRWKFQKDFWAPASTPGGSEQRHESPVQRNKRAKASHAGDRSADNRGERVSRTPKASRDGNIRSQQSQSDDKIFPGSPQKKYCVAPRCRSKPCRSSIKYWLSRIF
ncbi:micronuclear linker histone polyprotein-like isoform X2 [Ambystoma mexicanum]|uniref:micronuclear linker histone polyprotein-like isoform X2 n=1 Tax=Ambystoma mexicanum TaxID=8296 RepID=UPI0037E92AB9